MNKILISVILAAALAFGELAQAAPPTPTGRFHPATARELSLIKLAFAEKLKDPYSMKLAKVRVKDGSVCGYVNAKNSYGAYTGLKKFFGLFAPNDETKKEEFNIMAINSDDDPSADGFCVIIGYHE